MSNAMRFGKRSLAGLASGALLLSGIAIIAAQPAQAAGVFSVYCSGGTAPAVPGEDGTSGDPTSVDADCSIPSGATNLAYVNKSAVGTGAATFVQMSITGDAVWNDDTGSRLAALTAGTNYLLSADGKTLTIAQGSISAPTTTPALASDISLALTSNAPGQVTVAVFVSTAATINLVNTNKTQQGTFTVSAYGAPVTLGVTQYRYAIPANFSNNPDGLGTNEAWVGVVSARDSAGNRYPLNPSDDTAPTTTQFITTPGTNRDALEFTGITGDPFNVGVASVGPGGPSASVIRLMGANNYTVGLTGSLPNLTASGSYIVSSTLGANYTASFDKAAYDRGETGILTVCTTDLNGLIVPDGLSWDPGTANVDDTVNRSMRFDFNVDAVVPGITPVAINGFDDSVVTIDGCTSWAITMPGENVDFTVGLDARGSNQSGTSNNPGWTTVLGGPGSVTVKVGTGSGPDPVVPTIVISGSRGDGKPKSRKVYVEGVTTELAGQKVTPYFRIANASSFTKGNNERTVATDGTFKWQRKEGKRISVQFRFGDIKSNTIAFPARVKPSR